MAISVESAALTGDARPFESGREAYVLDPRFLPAASPAQRVAAESEEIPCPAKNPRRRRGFVPNREFLSWLHAVKRLFCSKPLWTKGRFFCLWAGVVETGEPFLCPLL